MKDWKKDFRKWVIENVSYNPEKDIYKVSILSYMLYKDIVGKNKSIEENELLEKAKICKEIILDEYNKGSFNKK